MERDATMGIDASSTAGGAAVQGAVPHCAMPAQDTARAGAAGLSIGKNDGGAAVMAGDEWKITCR